MQKPKIVLADDNQALVRALSIKLAHHGYEVVTAQDGYTALARSVQVKPDLLILDINMPAGNGFTVQQRMGKVPGMMPVPVIYVTGDKSTAGEQTARDLGAYALIHKPFYFQDLLEKVQGALTAPAA